MYRLFHIPTGMFLTEALKSIDIWYWLNDNPHIDRDDCMLYVYDLIEMVSLAKQ